MAISLYSSAKAAGDSVSIDIGASGENRLIVALVGVEASLGAGFQGEVSVDGKEFNQQIELDQNVADGTHFEAHVIDESLLGNSNGTLTVSYDGGDGTWGIQVFVFYGVKSATPYDSGTALVTSGTTISITGIDSLDECLVFMGAFSGLVAGNYGSWTSPLVEHQESPPGPTGALMAGASGIETTGQTNKTYSATDGTTRHAGLVMVFEAAEIVVDDVTSDKADGTYSTDEEIYICAEFSEQVSISGIPQLDLDVRPIGRKINYVPVWTPAELDSQMWYDSSDKSTITATGNQVSQLDDKSGKGIHMTQGVGGDSPNTDQAQINGLNTLVFFTDDMESTSNPFDTSVEDAMVFIVMRTANPLQNGTAFTLTGDNTGVNRWQAHAPWGSGSAIFDCGGTSGGNRLTAASWAAANEVLLGAFYGSTTENKQEIWKNGTLAANDTSGHSVGTIGNVFLGSGGPTGAQQDMDFGEMIVINGTVPPEIRERIEGYLAWKWGLVAQLPALHPYKNRPPLLWSPENTASDFWIDASDENSILDTAGDVDQWNDKSGNRRHVLQSTPADKPATGVTTQNGRNVVDFDGTEFLQTAKIANWLNTGEYSVFIAGKSNVTGQGYYLGTNQSVNGKGLHIGQRNGTQWTIAHYNDDADYSLAGTTDPRQTMSRYLDPGSILFSNGSAIGTNVSIPANDLDTDQGELNIGTGFDTTGAQVFEGSIFEILIIMGPVTTDLQNLIEGYLAWKWGLVDDLLTSHPYKRYAPTV